MSVIRKHAEDDNDAKPPLIVRKFFERDQHSPQLRVQRLIEKYKPQSEVYALNYGCYTLAVPAAITGYVSQRFFNQCFKLGRKKMTLIYMPILVIPSAATIMVHQSFIQETVFAERVFCAGCAQFKAAGMHFASGPLWSYFLSGFTACMLASLQKTMYVPPLEKHPIETIKMLGRQFVKFRRLGLFLSLGNIAYALVLTHLELREFAKVKLRLLMKLKLLSADFEDSEAQ